METQPKKVYVSTPHLKRYLIINQLHFVPVAASRHLSRHLSRHSSQILAEKPPDFVAGIHVSLCPTVLSADDLIQPDFNFRAALPGWLATTITVKHDGIAPQRQILGDLVGTFRLYSPLRNSHRHRQIRTPATFVFRLTGPSGSLVRSTMNLMSGTGPFE